MKPGKIEAGSPFPKISLQSLDGGTAEIGQPTGDTDWKMVVVYRGRHCPLCTKYLNQLETYKQQLLDNRIDLVAVSADSKSQLQSHLEKLDVSFPLCYGLTIEQMEELGLYISIPRSDKETDHPAVIPPDSKERKAIDPQRECIYCGLCYSACSVAGLDGGFLGPAALNRAFVVESDSREIHAPTEGVPPAATCLLREKPVTHLYKSCPKFESAIERMMTNLSIILAT